MQRKFLAAAICAIAVPALAAGQSASSANPHPSSSAHANAVAGETAAARIEACSRASDAFIREMAKGDFKAAVSNFDASMSRGLDADQLGAIWHSVVAKMGSLESQGTAQSVMFHEMPVASAPLHFRNGDVIARLACGKDGRFAGFHLQPAPSAAPATTAH